MRIPNTLVKKMGKMLKVASDPTRIKIMLCLLDPTKCTCKCKSGGVCAKCDCLSCMIAKKVTDIALEIGYGYYEGAYIDCKNEEDFENLEEFIKNLHERAWRFALSPMS